MVYSVSSIQEMLMFLTLVFIWLGWLFWVLFVSWLAGSCQSGAIYCCFWDECTDIVMNVLFPEQNGSKSTGYPPGTIRNLLLSRFLRVYSKPLKRMDCFGQTEGSLFMFSLQGDAAVV